MSRQLQQIVDLSGTSHVLFTLRKDLRLTEQSTVATGCPKRSSLKNWKGRDEEEDPGKDGEKK